MCEDLGGRRVTGKPELEWSWRTEKGKKWHNKKQGKSRTALGKGMYVLGTDSLLAVELLHIDEAEI